MHPYRGKCKEMAQAAIADDPSLRLVRGFYTCPIWNKREQHWWTVRPDGTIYDPSCAQFPSNGMGEYEEFNGEWTCDECGSQFAEGANESQYHGKYAFCSTTCLMKFVGL